MVGSFGSSPARASALGLTLALFAATPLAAQQAAPVEVSIGYLALSAGNDGYPKGYYVDLAANVHSRLGIIAATDGAYRSESFEYLIPRRGPSGTIFERLPVTLKTRTRGVVIGARVTWRDPRMNLFVQGLGGAAHLSAGADIMASTESAASLRDAYHASRWRSTVQAGAGANITINTHVGARIGIDYRRLERVPRGFAEGEDRGRGPNQILFAAGLVGMLGN